MGLQCVPPHDTVIALEINFLLLQISTPRHPCTPTQMNWNRKMALPYVKKLRRHSSSPIATPKPRSQRIYLSSWILFSAASKPIKLVVTFVLVKNISLIQNIRAVHTIIYTSSFWMHPLCCWWHIYHFQEER